MRICLRCPGCGREAREGAVFCEWCGASIVTPAFVSSPVELPSKKELPSALYVVVIGIVIIAVGGVLYAIAWTESMSADWWEDPTTSIDTFGGLFDLMMLSYIVMSIGTVILFIGLILLVMNE